MSGRTELQKRKVGGRDARMFLVATEGSKMEPAYFDALKANGVIDKFRVRLHVIETPKTGESAPVYVLERLKEACRRDEYADFDECWLVFDVDDWKHEMISCVVEEACELPCGVAISNPCFEAWVLLHFEESVPKKRREIMAALKRALPGFSKKKSRLPIRAFTREVVELAVERAKKGDCLDESWPKTPGTTRVYRLIENIWRAS